jgi:hypothetical protein
VIFLPILFLPTTCDELRIGSFHFEGLRSCPSIDLKEKLALMLVVTTYKCDLAHDSQIRWKKKQLKNGKSKTNINRKKAIKISPKAWKKCFSSIGK